YSCALDPAGTPTCWGSDRYRTTRAPQESFDELALGFDRACGITSSGAVSCWGDGESDHIPKQGVKKIGLGSRAIACVLDDMGAIDCWVPDSSSATGFAQTRLEGTYTDLTAESGNICAIDTSSRLRCWNTYNGSGWEETPLQSIEAVVGRYYQDVCGLTSAGTLACWGAMNGETTPSPDTLGPMVDMSISDAYACGVDAQGALSCWSTFKSSMVQYKPWDATPSGTFRAIESSQNRYCAIHTDDTLTCWQSM
ncbi:unnamed protein product, partial [Laminaria digitata]